MPAVPTGCKDGRKYGHVDGRKDRDVDGRKDRRKNGCKDAEVGLSADAAHGGAVVIVFANHKGGVTKTT
jgi:hypothetical protein